jgi:2-polyprenyl-6-methoxyphenol hydroxylase-like FAD-dependent oxidoreductase
MFERRDPTPDVPHPNPWMLGQDRTEAILRTRFAELGGRVEFGTALHGFVQDESGVTATLVRPDGARKTVGVAALVGADGGASTVRRELGIPFEGRTDESLRVLLGDVRVAGLDHNAGYWFADEHDLRRGIALSPLPGGDLFQFATPLGDRIEEPAHAVQAAFTQFCRLPGVALRDVAWSTMWRPNVRLARRYRDGRVLLAGDAAHVHPPTGGQGLNTGVQDAYNLGWKLAAALAAGPGPRAEALLDSYETERRPVAARVLRLSDDLLRRHAEGQRTRTSAARRPTSSTSATARARSCTTSGPTPGGCARATAPLTGRWSTRPDTRSACSISSAARTPRSSCSATPCPSRLRMACRCARSSRPDGRPPGPRSSTSTGMSWMPTTCRTAQRCSCGRTAISARLAPPR